MMNAPIKPPALKLNFELNWEIIYKNKDLLRDLMLS